MGYLIDSDWTIDYLQGRQAALALFERLAPDGLAVSVITYMEVYQGTLRSSDPEAAQAEFADFLSTVPILPLSESVARRAAELRNILDQQGRRVRARALDILNTATAIEHGLTLLTRNVADYEDIPSLRLYQPG